MPTSQNGYPANDRSLIKTWDVPGAGARIPLRHDDAGWLLVDLAAWIHRNVESIDAGHPMDDWGYAERTIRGSSTTLSNHASGTAFDFNATQHPLGVRGTWTPRQKRKINRALRNRYEGAIRWGENYSGRVDGMHFEIDADLDDVKRVARKLRGEENRPRRTPVVRLDAVRDQFRKGGTQPLRGVRLIQRELNRRGYGPLTVDGLAGARTRQAYRQFEKSFPGGNHNGIPGWLSLRVLAGILPLPQRRRFKVKR